MKNRHQRRAAATISRRMRKAITRIERIGSPDHPTVRNELIPRLTRLGRLLP